VKFKWVDGDGGYRVFFELHILVDELTKDVSLMVVDFAEKMKLMKQRSCGKIKYQT
jgi:DNA-binding ferritin-like protein